MADEQSMEWGLFSRFLVALFAAMIVAMAAKPYEKKFAPMLEKAKKMDFREIELPRRKFTEQATAPILPSASPKSEAPKKALIEKPKDKLTDTDKKQLNAVLDHL